MISSELKRRIDEYASRLDATSELLKLARAGALRVETVALYLVSIRHLIRQTPVHLAVARQRALASERPDLARYFDQKLAEETGHDRWADADLTAIGTRFGVTPVGAPAQAMEGLIDSLTALVRSEPESYLAYILFAEYFTVVIGPVWIEALTKYCGIPEGAMTVIEHHVELDKHHVLAGCAEIDQLVRDPDSATRLHVALTATMLHYDRFILELVRANREWPSTPTTLQSTSSANS
jgi:hypothetical protein